MAALTSLAIGGAILGGASMGYGLYNQMEGQEQAQAGYALQQQGALRQAEAARVQAEISKEQAATSVVFAGRERELNQLASDQSLAFSTGARDINQQIVNSERQIEGQRRTAMELDARRKGVEVIRNQQRARALALTNATAQGAARGSGLQGGYGQIAGQSGVNAMGIQQNLQIGQSIFDANAQIINQKENYANLQYGYQVQQAANQTTKSNMLYDLATLNANYQTRMADAGTFMSQGQGMINQGQGMIGSGQMQSQLGSTFMSMGPQIFGMGMTAGNLFAGAGSTGLGGMFGFNPATGTSGSYYS